MIRIDRYNGSRDFVLRIKRRPVMNPQSSQQSIDSPMVVIVSINGNIGSGKSTLLSAIAKEHARRLSIDPLRVSIRVLTEPLSEWRCPVLKGGKQSMLEAFYEDVHKNAFPFQMYILFTRMQQLHDELEKCDDSTVLFIERGPWVDLDLMGGAVRRTGGFSEMDWMILRQWHDLMLKTLPPVRAYVYLRACPDQCVSRIRVRGRGEEVRSVNVDYLQVLHDVHEKYYNDYDKSLKYLMESSQGAPESIARELMDWIETVGI